MSQSFATPASNDLVKVLARALEQYQPAAKQSAVLERYKDIVLGFRAKGASCAELEKIFREHGLHILEHTLARFCRRHEAEILRLRQKLRVQADQNSPEESLNNREIAAALPAVQPQPTSPHSPKTRSMRGPV